MWVFFYLSPTLSNPLFILWTRTPISWCISPAVSLKEISVLKRNFLKTAPPNEANVLPECKSKISLPAALLKNCHQLCNINRIAGFQLQGICANSDTFSKECQPPARCRQEQLGPRNTDVKILHLTVDASLVYATQNDSNSYLGRPMHTSA